MNLWRLPCAVIRYLVSNVIEIKFGPEEPHDYVSRTSPRTYIGNMSNEEIDQELE